MNESLHTPMDTLLVKYLLGEATAAERQEVENWVAECEANKKQLTDIELVWSESRKLAANSTVNEHAAWYKFQQLANEPRKKASLFSLSKQNNFVKVAAAVLLLVLGGWLTNNLLNKNIPNTDTAVFVQAQQKVLADTLPDGSLVTLNKNSSLEYKQAFTSENIRAVKLKGEAFFNITANKEKPFVITVNDVQVKVIGTSFNIKTIHNQTEVIVKTGIVEVIHKGKTIRLSPNEKMLTPATDTTLTKSAVTDKLYEYYISKEFVCENIPLWRLAEVLNEVYNSNIVIESAELRNLRLNTVFNNEQLDTILGVIAQTFQLKIVKKENKIILQ